MRLEDTDGQALLSCYAEPATSEYDAFVLLDRIETSSIPHNVPDPSTVVVHGRTEPGTG